MSLIRCLSCCPSPRWMVPWGRRSTCRITAAIFSIWRRLSPSPIASRSWASCCFGERRCGGERSPVFFRPFDMWFWRPAAPDCPRRFPRTSTFATLQLVIERFEAVRSVTLWHTRGCSIPNVYDSRQRALAEPVGQIPGLRWLCPLRVIDPGSRCTLETGQQCSTAALVWLFGYAGVNKSNPAATLALAQHTAGLPRPNESSSIGPIFWRLALLTSRLPQ